MTEPIEVSGLQRRLSDKYPGIPSGVMQAVLMHAWQLRRDCREVYVLCEIQGCSITETASTLGVTADVVLKRLRRARTQMEGVIKRLCEIRTLQHG